MSADRDSIVIDGVEVSFEPVSEGVSRVLAGEREIGRLELADDSSEMLAFRPGGEPIRTHSKWGGSIPARFGSREVAARALMKG